jgi:pimeloyl-ACP methyl ester carboxylesterase
MPIVLLGHSCGGAVITNAAVGDPEVKALVFVGAFIPDLNETLGGLLSSVPGSCLAGNPADIFNLVPCDGGPTGDVDTYIKPSLVPCCSAAACPPARPRSSPPSSGHWRPAPCPSPRYGIHPQRLSSFNYS